MGESTPRSVALAVCGTRDEGAPTMTPRARATMGSSTVHITEADRTMPAMGFRKVERASSAWSTTGILSARISMTVAIAKTVSAVFEPRNRNESPRGRTPSLTESPTANSGQPGPQPGTGRERDPERDRLEQVDRHRRTVRR